MYATYIVFWSDPQKKFEVSELVWRYVIEGYARAGQLEKAFLLVDQVSEITLVSQLQDDTGTRTCDETAEEYSPQTVRAET